MIEWLVGDLGTGEQGEKTFVARVSSTATTGTHVVSVASITANTGAPASSTATVDVIDDPVIFLAKTVNVSTANVGDQVTFRIDFQNVGGAPLTGITLTDVLPDGLVAVSASDGGVVAGDTVTWSLPDLPAGAEKVVTLVARVGSGANGELVNRVTLTSRERSAEAASATLAVGVDVVPVPVDMTWLLAILSLLLLGLGRVGLRRRRLLERPFSH